MLSGRHHGRGVDGDHHSDRVDHSSDLRVLDTGTVGLVLGPVLGL